MKCVGLDYGRARIGIAASDEGGEIAFARSVLARVSRARDLAAVAALVREEGARAVVVGLPLRQDGSEGDAAAAARRFAARVAETTGVAVVLHDERFSTLEAAEALHEVGLSTRGQKARIDGEAARVLLQRYLDGPREPA